MSVALVLLTVGRRAAMAIVSAGPLWRVAGGRTWVLGLGLSLACASLTGCESDQNTPASLPASASASATSTARNDDEGSVPTVVLIVPRDGLVDSTVWEQLARILAPRVGALSEVIKAEKGHQAEAVREATRRGASALILVSPDETEPELASALRAARESTRAARQRPLPILLGLKGIDIGGEHLPVIRFDSLADSAKQLIAVSLEDARKQGYPDPPKAVILCNGPYDFEGQARVDAMRKALTDAQVDLLPDAAFTGYMAQGGEALNKVLEAHPDLAIVIATDDQGGRAAGTIHDQLDKAQRRFVLGVVGPAKELERLAQFKIASGLVVRDGELLARKALTEALNWSRGGDVPSEDIVVPAPFQRSTGPEIEGFAPKNMERPPSPGKAKGSAEPIPR